MFFVDIVPRALPWANNVIAPSARPSSLVQRRKLIVFLVFIDIRRDRTELSRRLDDQDPTALD
jgi:hypothetical protein